MITLPRAVDFYDLHVTWFINGQLGWSLSRVDIDFFTKRVRKYISEGCCVEHARKVALTDWMHSRKNNTTNKYLVWYFNDAVNFVKFKFRCFIEDRVKAS